MFRTVYIATFVQTKMSPLDLRLLLITFEGYRDKSLELSLSSSEVPVFLTGLLEFLSGKPVTVGDATVSCTLGGMCKISVDLTVVLLPYELRTELCLILEDFSKEVGEFNKKIE